MNTHYPQPPAVSAGTRIAVVEDDPDLREITTEFLEDKGYDVCAFESAEAFYRAAAIRPVDVVVLDIGLPGEDGLSVVRHLRALPKVRVIIVSARVSESDRRAGLEAGAERYLIKPIILDELASSIEHMATRSTQANAVGQDRDQPVRPADRPWRLDKEAWQLLAPNGMGLSLSAREFLFLNCVMGSPGVTIAQETVTSAVYPGRVMNRHERMDVMLSRLRKKCLDRLGLVLPVKTAHLMGYVFTAQSHLF